VTPRSWEHSITHYEAKGHRVIAPGYPGSEMEVEELNADPGIIPGEGAFSALRSPGNRHKAVGLSQEEWKNARWASPPPAGKRGRAGDRDAAPGGGGYSR
jgi:hypothetical protein